MNFVRLNLCFWEVERFILKVNTIGLVTYGGCTIARAKSTCVSSIQQRYAYFLMNGLATRSCYLSSSHNVSDGQ